MTRTPEILGSEYDAPAKLPERLAHYEKRGIALAELERAEANGDSTTAELMYWELGLLDLLLSPPKDVSPYHRGTYEVYAEHYRLTDNTVAYARKRANETRDLILKLHYLTFVLLRSKPTGKAWIQLQQELLATHREYIRGCLQGSKSDPDRLLGLCVDEALTAVGPLMARPGVLRKDEQAGWAQWIVGLAEESLMFPLGENEEYLRHRWIADYLEHLTELSAPAVSLELQAKALGLISNAAVFYEANPLADRGSFRVAEAEAKLRKHWGEEGEKVHERKIRCMFAALLRRAEFFQQAGNGFITANAFREARQLVEQERRIFTNDEVARLQRAEQVALHRAVEAGELVPFKVSFKVPRDLMDYTQETPEKTVEALVEQAIREVPNRKEIAEKIQEMSAETPLLAMVKRTVISPGKVVGESDSLQGNLDLDTERRAMERAHLFGAAVSITAIRAAEAVGLQNSKRMLVMVRPVPMMCLLEN
jgi:hypothetical protein